MPAHASALIDAAMSVPTPAAAQPFERMPALRDDTAVRDSLAAAASRAEVARLNAGLSYRLGKPGALPFVLDLGALICTVAPDALGHPAAAIGMVRQAAEIALWKRAGLGSSAVDDIALTMLSCRAAGLALNTYPLIDRLNAIAHVPVWLATAWRLFANSGRTDEAWRMLATDLGSRTFLPLLLRMQGYGETEARGIAASQAVRRQAHARFDALAALAAPTEWTLAAGGDPRVALDPETGRNSYGSCTRPIPEEISLSSSTATTVTADAFAAAEATRQSLMAAAVRDDFEAAFDDELKAVRAFLIERTGARAAILTASGTDTAFIALAVAMAGHERPVASVVLAPAETGSGIPLAAAGRHFLGRTAHGHAVDAGACVEGFADALGGERTRVRTVPIRAADGTPLTPEALDAGIAAAVASEITQGRTVLLHALASSKTGMGGPSPALLADMRQRYGRDLHVVVDACQLRSGLGAVQAWLTAGAMVQITGSKFMAGPPFSGALLLPAAAVERLAAAGHLPVGLRQYCGLPEWDAALAPIAAELPAFRNLGLLARWRAALATWREAELLTGADIETALTIYGQAVMSGVGGRKTMDLVESPLMAASENDALGHGPTIFAVRLREGPNRPWLDMAACKRVHLALQRDLADQDSDLDQRAVLSRPVAVGQPVQIGATGGGALRLCANAVLLGQLAHGGARAARLTGDLSLVLDKIDAILALGLHRPAPSSSPT